MDRRTGIVLSGGAAYGAYEVGVLSALVAGRSPASGFIPFDPGIVVGTSAGAFNSSTFVAAADGGARAAADLLTGVWLEEISASKGHPAGGVLNFRGDPRKFNPAYFLTQPLSALRDLTIDVDSVFSGLVRVCEQFRDTHATLIDLLDLRLFISTQPLVDLISNTVDFAAIRRSSRQLRVAATNWSTGQVRVFENREMTDASGRDILLASNAIPGIFPTRLVDGATYVDGGVVMNTPLKPALDAGADVIHVVSVNPSFQPLSGEPPAGTITTMYRTLAIALESSLANDIQLAGRLNNGIRLMQSRSGPALSEQHQLRDMALIAGSAANRETPAPYRPITIHRHMMTSDDGRFTSFLDFSRARLEALMKQGQLDAVNHDCARNGCVIGESREHAQAAGRKPDL